MHKIKNKISVLQMIRRITQIIAVFLVPGLFSSTLYAMKAIYTSLINGNFVFSDVASQILLLLITIPLTVIMGRFFCGFFCAFGSLGDLLWFISSKTIKPRFRIPEKADSALKHVKYGILIAIIGIWTFHFITIQSTSDPWTVFGMLLPGSGLPSLTYLFSIGGLLLLLIMVGSLFVERFFCRYLCPLGAIFAVSSRFRLFNIRKNRNNCGSCKLCTRKCSMGIPLYQYDKVTSGECINCFVCMEHCPKSNISANPAPVVASAASIAAVSGLIYVGNIASASEISSTAINNSTISISSTTGKYTDGTYSGSAFGFRGDTEVSVTVENGNITDIEILNYQDDQKYMVRAINNIIPEIIESQDITVDAVSGATFSSNGIMNAVADALNQTVEAIENNTSEQSSANQQEEQDQITQNDEAEGVFEDGTYTGSGSGYRGNTEVSVTVENGRISDITVQSYEDDYQFFVRAENTVISEIIEQQGVEVDAVSGATFSSNGIIEAVANALGVDYTNPNSSMTRGGHGGFHGDR